MRLTITGDTDEKSRVDEVLLDLVHAGYEQYFAGKRYGAGIREIVVVLVCQDHLLGLKQRIRFVRKEKTLYMDVMLDLHGMKAATPSKRRKSIIRRLSEEVCEVLSRYDIPDFDGDRFVRDFLSWLGRIRHKVKEPPLGTWGQLHQAKKWKRVQGK